MSFFFLFFLSFFSFFSLFFSVLLCSHLSVRLHDSLRNFSISRGDIIRFIIIVSLFYIPHVPCVDSAMCGRNWKAMCSQNTPGFPWKDMCNRTRSQTCQIVSHWGGGEPRRRPVEPLFTFQILTAVYYLEVYQSISKCLLFFLFTPIGGEKNKSIRVIRGASGDFSISIGLIKIALIPTDAV